MDAKAAFHPFCLADFSKQLTPSNLQSTVNESDVAKQVKADLESQKQASLGLKVEANELNSMAVGCQSAKLMGTVSNHDESSPVKGRFLEASLFSP